MFGLDLDDVEAQASETLFIVTIIDNEPSGSLSSEAEVELEGLVSVSPSGQVPWGPFHADLHWSEFIIP